MNCQGDLIARGGAKESLGNLDKEPDESWGPTGVAYTTLVLEVGMKESLIDNRLASIKKMEIKNDSKKINGNSNKNDNKN
jgi:hypothetical protein